MLFPVGDTATIRSIGLDRRTYLTETFSVAEAVRPLASFTVYEMTSTNASVRVSKSGGE